MMQNELIRSCGSKKDAGLCKSAENSNDYKEAAKGEVVDTRDRERKNPLGKLLQIEQCTPAAKLDGIVLGLDRYQPKQRNLAMEFSSASTIRPQ